MKFPYIPIQPLIDEAFEDVKRIAKTVNYNDGDAYVWAVDTAREIGGYAYEEASTELVVKNHVAFLPKDFYLFSELWNCSKKAGVAASEPVRPGVIRPDIMIRTTIIRPADSMTRKRCHLYCESPNDRYAGSTFTAKIPPGIMRFSFRDGDISMDYYRLPVDENGEVLVQDEINGIKCIKANIIMKLMFETWVGGEMRQDVWNDLKNDYDTYLRLAKQMQMAPDPSQTMFLAIKQDQRYRNMRYIYQ